MHLVAPLFSKHQSYITVRSYILYRHDVSRSLFCSPYNLFVVGGYIFGKLLYPSY
ncbi:unnamed protein product [Rhodiola kirilowii]